MCVLGVGCQAFDTERTFCTTTTQKGPTHPPTSGDLVAELVAELHGVAEDARASVFVGAGEAEHDRGLGQVGVEVPRVRGLEAVARVDNVDERAEALLVHLEPVLALDARAAAGQPTQRLDEGPSVKILDALVPQHLLLGGKVHRENESQSCFDL